MLQNPSLEAAGSNGVPTCWLLAGYGTNGFTWTRTSDAHTGGFAEKLDVTSWTNGDRKLVSTQDNGACAPAVVPGHTYMITEWYKAASGNPSIFAFYRNSAGSWVFWAQSPKFATTSAWAQATWTTPAFPFGATAISVGMGLGKTGSVTMDDAALYDTSVPQDTTPPTSKIACNGSACASSYYTAAVSVTLSATDSGGSGLKEIRYTTDGSDPSATNGTVYGGSFNLTTTKTVKYRAFDNAGNAEPVNAQLIEIGPMQTYFGTLPPDSPLPRTDLACAALVTPNPWEPRPDNFPANLTVPTGPVPWAMTPDELYWTKWIAKRDQVTGNYTGTTDEIIRWAACKWGIDENTIRAVAVQESDWHQNSVGDNGKSFGIMQIKDQYADGSPAWGGYPWTQESTPLNVDFYAAYIRSCLNGDFYDGGWWLYGGMQIKGDLWGCVGSWYSGGWYDAGALDYISHVQTWLASKTWLTY